jgi:hypothetical protein
VDGRGLWGVEWVCVDVDAVLWVGEGVMDMGKGCAYDVGWENSIGEK